MISKFIAAILGALERTSRNQRPIIALVQLVIFFFSGVAAFLLRFDFTIPPAEREHVTLALSVWVVTKAVAYGFSQLERGWWKFVSIADVQKILRANFYAALASTFLIRIAAGPSFPRSLFLLDFLLCFMASVGVRVAVRVNAEAADQSRAPAGKRILIYGAGAAGTTLLREIRSDARLLYDVRGFIDDNPGLDGVLISGAPVLGTGENLSAAVRGNQIAEVLIAIPSAGGEQMARILNLCQAAGVQRKTIPGLAEIIQGNGLARQIRDVEVEDLLGRAPVNLTEFRTSEKLRDKVVMVTGAAGSIGSELCRQIARSGAKALVAFEISESALFELEREMTRLFPGFTMHSEIGSTQNARRISEVMAAHKPSILYHAAAYKHVPMMELHPFESVENNVFGSVITARCAVEQGLTDFVMISTDKAVRPTSVMGATKRIAELAIAAIQTPRTTCVSVRFGNVLGSTGSVVPVFKEQIARGGPVLVTHPDMERFFMTIPEAVQLVLQASAMGRGGEVFVLNMGHPVKIVDLAKNLIVLSGLRPGDDIRIEFTGMRPGEKLREEVQRMQEMVVPTEHDKIRILRGEGTSPELMQRHLDALRRICETRDIAQLLSRFQEIIPEFTPGLHLLQRALTQTAGAELSEQQLRLQ